MKKITKQHFLKDKDFFIQEILRGKLFIYPTDTVLGIGCTIDHEKSIEKIFELKQRENKPLLMIIPDVSWIETHCIFHEEHKDFVASKLPGPYSFIVDLLDPDSVSSRINNNTGTVGVRIPGNWFSIIVSEIGIPFISTSVNISGQPSCLDISSIPQNILEGVDYVIESDDEFLGKSSIVIDIRETQRTVLRK